MSIPERLEKEEQTKPNHSRKKEIAKIRIKLKEPENRRTQTRTVRWISSDFHWNFHQIALMKGKNRSIVVNRFSGRGFLFCFVFYFNFLWLNLWNTFSKKKKKTTSLYFVCLAKSLNQFLKKKKKTFLISQCYCSLAFQKSNMQNALGIPETSAMTFSLDLLLCFSWTMSTSCLGSLCFDCILCSGS